MSQDDTQSESSQDDESEDTQDQLGADIFGKFRIEIDPDRVDEAVRSLSERVRKFVEHGRYTKVRIKYKGKPLVKDIPLGVFVATEAMTFWYGGLLRALMVNIGIQAIIEVELIHDADEQVAEGKDLYMAGEVQAAEEKYRKALSMRPDDPSALYNLGVLLRVTGRRQEAIEALQASAKDIEHPDAIKAAEALTRMDVENNTL